MHQEKPLKTGVRLPGLCTVGTVDHKHTSLRPNFLTHYFFLFKKKKQGKIGGGGIEKIL